MQTSLKLRDQFFFDFFNNGNCQAPEQQIGVLHPLFKKF
jgi:hypothetical protein